MVMYLGLNPKAFLLLLHCFHPLLPCGSKLKTSQMVMYLGLNPTLLSSTSAMWKQVGMLLHSLEDDDQSSYSIPCMAAISTNDICGSCILCPSFLQSLSIASHPSTRNCASAIIHNMLTSSGVTCRACLRSCTITSMMSFGPFYPVDPCTLYLQLSMGCVQLLPESCNSLLLKAHTTCHNPFLFKCTYPEVPLSMEYPFTQCFARIQT